MNRHIGSKVLAAAVAAVGLWMITSHRGVSVPDSASTEASIHSTPDSITMAPSPRHAITAARILLTGEGSSEQPQPGDRILPERLEHSLPSFVERVKRDLTNDNMGHSGLDEDFGPEVRAVQQGLDIENVDLGPLLGYVASFMGDSWAVPDSAFATISGKKRSSSWFIAYENSRETVSVANIVVNTSPESVTTYLFFPIREWGREFDPDLSINPRLRLSVTRNVDGTLSGNVGIDPQPDADDVTAAKLMDYEERGMIGAEATIDIADGSGRMKFYRTGSARALSPVEMDALVSFHDACKSREKDVVDQ